MIAQAEPHSKTIRFMCGSREEWLLTAEKYNEDLVLAAPSPNKETVISLWVNFETGSSSWITQIVETDEWCMTGLGDKVLIPEGSPLKDSPIGKRVTFK